MLSQMFICVISCHNSATMASAPSIMDVWTDTMGIYLGKNPDGIHVLIQRDLELDIDVVLKAIVCAAKKLGVIADGEPVIIKGCAVRDTEPKRIYTSRGMHVPEHRHQEIFHAHGENLRKYRDSMLIFPKLDDRGDSRARKAVFGSDALSKAISNLVLQ